MDNIKNQKSKIKSIFKISKIYIFGSPLIKEDSLPFQLIPHLQKKFPGIELIISDPNQNFPPKDEKNLLIIDTVFGVKKPTLLDLDDLRVLKKSPVSPHDYDLLFHLQLLKKTKRIEDVKIIGLPFSRQKIKFTDEIINEIITIIKPIIINSAYLKK